MLVTYDVPSGPEIFAFSPEAMEYTWQTMLAPEQPEVNYKSSDR
jgi:hypothetical protein